MSGSETGAVTTTEQFTVGVQKPPPPVQQPPVVQNMHLTYSSDGTPLYKPVSASSPPPYQSSGGGDVSAAPAPLTVFPPQQNLNMNMNMGEQQGKKKRGRPRKYGPDGSMALALSASPASAPSSGGAFSPPVQSQQVVNSPVGGSTSGSPFKKVRGRPPGSSNKKHQMEVLGSAGIGFTPHVISVRAGEDVSSKIMSFSQNGPRAVCILSASGAISNVTLRQAATSGGTATYEGRFDILSLSGSFLLSEIGGQRSRTGGLSVSLAGPDGRVLGGCVAGLLTAASPVQVIVGSFIADGRKESKTINQIEPLSASQKFISGGGGGGGAGPSSPPSRGTLSESSGGPGSPLNQSTGAYHNSHPQGMSSMPWK